MKATFTDRRRSAFTLVELLVVVGLMGMLATVSIAGYNAATRGMADRGAVQSAVSMLRTARQTCRMDRVPVKVMFFNQLLGGDSANADDDSAKIYQGTAIAIKQTGRITMNPSAVNMLVDEFADWKQSYTVQGSAGSSGQSGMRFFRMSKDNETADIDGCSTLVQPFVKELNLDDYMIQAGVKIDDWCARHQRGGNNSVYGFVAASGGYDNWKVGDAYGMEIARVDLPKGYIFGKSAPSDGSRFYAASVAAVTFNLENRDVPMSQDVPVSVMRPDANGDYKPRTVATITKSMLDDTFGN